MPFGVRSARLIRHRASHQSDLVQAHPLCEARRASWPTAAMCLCICARTLLSVVQVNHRDAGGSAGPMTVVLKRTDRELSVRNRLWQWRQPGKVGSICRQSRRRSLRRIGRVLGKIFHPPLQRLARDTKTPVKFCGYDSKRHAGKAGR